ncbi:MAG: AAA family ATPase [Myxococcales bacterium]|nr:AAA family ATPase [Myxococcales bacterium]MCB9548351.1 AAA family ATPase [Myxococcales bacterium]
MAEDWTFEALDAEIDDIRHRVLQHGRFLASYFVGRDTEAELMLLAAATQEPLLFAGPPGTAKSDLVLKFVESLGLGGEDYFEYMLTKFTEPSEILGPIDIAQLKDGRFRRRTRGMLPEAKVVFLDEIFKSNSAILNTLLTIVNERKFYQDGAPEPVQLRLLFAATNDIPEQSELVALSDRFVLKVETRPVKERHFEALIDAGMRTEASRALSQRPWADGPASFIDFLKLKRYLDLHFAESGRLGDHARWFPPAIFAELRRIVRVLETEDQVYVSDRKAVKIYKLIRARAFLHHGGAVQAGDLRVLRYVGNRRAELPIVEEKVNSLLGLDG